MSNAYREAGVDVEAGDRFVDSIKALAASTARAGADAALGGFGALFDLKRAGFRDPILVASTDGVGTKVKLAAETGRHRGVGIDLVAMCVNDLVVQGAEPLFFLDYMASGRLRPEVAHALVDGIADGCRQAGCALIGGETAEMPGVYALGDYDLAGFAVGAAERGAVLDGRTIRPGDAVIGLASDGVHANGFSLVRRVLAEAAVDAAAAPPYPSDAASLVEDLMRPTRIYVRACLAAHRAGLVAGFANITGGGLVTNPHRVLPPGTAVRIDCARWTPAPVFRWLAAKAAMDPHDLAGTFNCGIGMLAYVPAAKADVALALFREMGERPCVIGDIVAHDGPTTTILEGLDTWRS
ncbi:MAG: phosphoribosylformylglycinamidine cyclo-ligase [Alphaproteobacteria bacterium]